MSLDVDASSMLRSLGDDSPCGQNLEYDAEFLQMEEAARVQPKQEFANADTGTRLTIDGQGANWLDVRRLAESLFQRTRDLRVATYYTRALLHTEGFAGLPVGLNLIHGLLNAQWAHVHPQLDPDDGNDPTMRVNALTPLVAADAVLEDLRAAWLVKSRQTGILTVRDIEVAQGRLAPRAGEQAFSEAQVAGMLGEALALDSTIGQSVQESVSLIEKLSSLLQDKVGAEAALDFKPLQSMLQVVSRALPAGSAAGNPLPATAAAEILAGPAVAVARPGEIASRQDVMTTLERLIQYLEHNEPSSPAQLLLRRAQRVMNMNFLEAMNELAPDGLVQAERSVGGQLNQ